MSYKVVNAFADAHDNGHTYNVGDNYPRVGMEVSVSRFEELSTTKNPFKTIFIKEEKSARKNVAVEDKTEEKREAKYTRKDIQFMKAEDLKALAVELGLDSELSGAKLKPLIIERLGL